MFGTARQIANQDSIVRQAAPRPASLRATTKALGRRAQLACLIENRRLLRDRGQRTNVAGTLILIAAAATILWRIP